MSTTKTMILRKYQQKLVDEIHSAWDSVQNVFAVLPCGGGKTFLFSDIIYDHVGGVAAIAHRQELIGQISLSLAKYGIHHGIVSPRKVVQWICRLHIQEFGKSFYDPNSMIKVAAVNTIINRPVELQSWLNQVTLWVTDESHHLLADNIWGKATKMFPNAKGLGVSATPCRSDGKGLGRKTDGVFDTLVTGPTMRELIDQGHLLDYRLFAPPSNLDLTGVNITATGDLNQKKLKKAVRKSTIMGDVVEHYLRIAPGMLGITFATDIETAHDIADKFNAAGVPAEVVSSKTKEKPRIEIFRKFKNKEILQLVNVDIVGEGVDIPACEVVSLARPTESFGLHKQQTGRVLRTHDDVKFGIIIDHVGNCLRHGLPDHEKVWTLDRREKRKKSDKPTIMVRICKNCTGSYEAYKIVCPYCGDEWVPVNRTSAEAVDGDLVELSPEVLAQMRSAVAKVDEPTVDLKKRLIGWGFTGLKLGGALKHHNQQQEVQDHLRHSIALWAGYHKAAGIDDREIHRRFYLDFGIDIMSAQALKRGDSLNLINKVVGCYGT